MKSIFRKNYPGFLSPLFYGVVPIIVLVQFSGSTFLDSFANGASLTFLKDIWGIPLNLLLVFMMGKKLQLWQTIFSKDGVFIMIAGVFGGPIGYTLYNTAFYIAGPSFGHVFTSLEPVILVGAVYLAYRRKFNLLILFGIILTTISVVCLVFGGAYSGKTPAKIMLGSLLGILGACSWTVESFLFDKVLKKDAKHDVNVLITIKMISALFFNVAVFMPLIGGINGTPGICFERIGEGFSNTHFLWRILLGGILIFIGRLLFFDSIKRVGPTISNVYYEISIVVTPIFSLIIYAITKEFVGHDASLIDPKFQIVFWITSAGIIAGALMCIAGQSLRFKKTTEKPLNKTHKLNSKK